MKRLVKKASEDRVFEVHKPMELPLSSFIGSKEDVKGFFESINQFNEESDSVVLLGSEIFHIERNEGNNLIMQINNFNSSVNMDFKSNDSHLNSLLADKTIVEF